MVLFCGLAGAGEQAGAMKDKRWIVMLYLTVGACQVAFSLPADPSVLFNQLTATRHALPETIAAPRITIASIPMNYHIKSLRQQL